MSDPINPIAGLRRFDITRRGYHVQQVDALLDLVERRFVELHVENAEMRSRIAELSSANPIDASVGLGLLARAQAAERRLVDVERDLAGLRDLITLTHFAADR